MPIERMQIRALRELRGAAGPSATHAMPAPLGTAAERARVRLVGAVFVVYLLAIFEGAIRKFLLPQFSQYVFFIRDPFLIYAYFLATLYGLWPRNNPWFVLSVVMAGVGVLLFAMQSAIGGPSETRVLLGVYGWRSYFMYVPLAFLVGATFRAADLSRFIRLTLWLSLPIALLVVAQFSSPVDAPINVGIAEEKELQFTSMRVTGKVVRTSGPFTSNVGQQQFVTTACAFVLALLIAPAARRRAGVVLVAAAACAVLTCIALSGSRGTVLQCMLIALFAMAVGPLGRGAALKAKAMALPMALVIAAVALYPIVFPQGFAAFTERWNAAEAAETKHFEGGVFGRALYSLIDFGRLVETVPILGYGLGYGGNASITLRATVDDIMPGLLAEVDYSRHMVDLGPIFGVAYILMRVALVVWLAKRVWFATRRVPDPLPMMLFAYVGYVVLQSQLTGHGSITVYGWLFTGLCIAAVREALQTKNQTLAATVVDIDGAGTTRRQRLALPPLRNRHHPPLRDNPR